MLLLLTGVTAANTAPSVDAGSDIIATTLVLFNLDGTVTDDGLPSGILTYSWTQQSGPGTITFTDATLVDTTASANLAGVYVVRLTASDGSLSAFDELQVFVSDPAAGGSGEDNVFSFWR